MGLTSLAGSIHVHVPYKSIEIILINYFHIVHTL